jgi:hypothetical protein
VVLPDSAEALSHSCSPSGYLHDDDAAVICALCPGHQTIILELAHLATCRRRVHLGDSGELTQGQVPIFLETA